MEYKFDIDVQQGDKVAILGIVLSNTHISFEKRVTLAKYEISKVSQKTFTLDKGNGTSRYSLSSIGNVTDGNITSSRRIVVKDNEPDIQRAVEILKAEVNNYIDKEVERLIAMLDHMKTMQIDDEIKVIESKLN